MHQAITLIAVIVRVFSKLAMENATHPFSRVQNVAHYSRAPDGGWNVQSRFGRNANCHTGRRRQEWRAPKP
jgi:hypothetical protein